MPDPISAQVKKLAIGSKIRTLRERCGLTVAELASRTGMPEVVLAQIESEVIAPTVAALVNIGHALGSSVDAFFRDSPLATSVEVVRRGEGQKVRRVRGTAGETPLSYSYESLAWRLDGKHMEPFLVEFSLDAEEPARAMSHDGEEFLFILEGEVEFLGDEERVVLRPGDSIYFYSRSPHTLRGIGQVTPRALAVLLPQTRAGR